MDDTEGWGLDDYKALVRLGDAVDRVADGIDGWGKENNTALVRCAVALERIVAVLEARALPSERPDPKCETINPHDRARCVRERHHRGPHMGSSGLQWGFPRGVP